MRHLDTEDFGVSNKKINVIVKTPEPKKLREKLIQCIRGHFLGTFSYKTLHFCNEVQCSRIQKLQESHLHFKMFFSPGHIFMVFGSIFIGFLLLSKACIFAENLSIFDSN